MAYDASIGVNLYGRDVSASKALRGVGNSAKSAGDYIKDAGRKATIAFSAIAATAILSAKAAAEDSEAAGKLALTMKNVSGATAATTDKLERYITRVSLATGVSDDELRPSMDRLVRSTKSLSEAHKLQTVAMDIAALTGNDLVTVSNAIAKAHDGNIGALKKLGLTIDKTTIKNKDFNKAMKEAAAQSKGQMAAAADTTAGKMRRLTNATKELRESIGYALLPAMERLIGYFEKVIPFIERNQKLIVPLGAAFAGLALSVMAIAGAVKVYEAALVVATVAQAAFNAVFYASPLGKWVMIITAIAAAMAALYAKNENFRNFVQGVIEIHKKMFAAIGNFFTETLPRWWGNFVDFMKSVPEKIKATGKFIFDVIVAPYKLAFNQIAWLWNNTVGKLSFTIPDWIPKIGGNTISFPKIPMLAEGGIVTGPTLAMIGEAGPEAVVPLRDGGFGGGITVNINVTGSLVTQKELVESVRNEMAQLLRRKGAPISALGY